MLINLKALYQKKEIKKIEKCYLNFDSNLARHPHFSFLNNRSVLEEIRREYFQGNQVIIALLDILNQTNSFKPVFLIYLWEEESNFLKRLKNVKYDKLREPILRLVLFIVNESGIKSGSDFIRVLENKSVVDGLIRIRSQSGIGSLHFLEWIEMLMTFFRENNEMQRLEYFFLIFVNTDWLDRIDRIIFIKGRCISDLLKNTLILLVDKARHFSDLGNLSKGITFLESEEFISNVDIKGIEVFQLGIFFGECLEKGFTLMQLGEVIDIIASSKKNQKIDFFKIKWLEEKILSLLRLSRAEFDRDRIEEIWTRLNGIQGLITFHFTISLLKVGEKTFKVNSLSLLWELTEAANRHWGRSARTSIRNLKVYSYLAELISHDHTLLILKFADFLKSKKTFVQDYYFQLLAQLLKKSEGLDILQCFIDLTDNKKLILGKLIHPKIYLSELNENISMIVDICLSRWLNNLLEQHKYPPNLYIERIRVLLDTCQETEESNLFFQYLYEVFKKEIDLGEWLDYCQQNANDKNTFLKKINPQEFISLHFHEVEPFLQQYNIALFGRLKMEISKSGIPNTDGVTVFLPDQEKKYGDSKKDLYLNRNASLYVANSFHEVGYHIRAGSFLADARPTLKQFSNVDLAHMILNIMEDYRGRQHFLSHPFNRNWMRLLDEDEKIITSELNYNNNWRDQFMLYLKSKGIHGYTPGELKASKKETEYSLMKRKIKLYLPPAGILREFTLKTLMKKLLTQIATLKGKTVADSLLLLKPLYQIISQVIGEDYILPDEYPILTPDFTQDAGGDIIVIKNKIRKKQDREDQLRMLSTYILPFQAFMDVPLKIEEEKNKESTAVANVGNDSNQPPSPTNNTHTITEKIFVGNYDHVTKRMVKSQHRVIIKRLEKLAHPEFKNLYKKYHKIYFKVEEEIQKLLQRKEWIETEGNEPDEMVMENVLEGIADPNSIPFIDLYENEINQTKELIPSLEVKILVDASGSTSGQILEVEKVFATVLHRAFKLLGFSVNLYFFKSWEHTYIYHTLDLGSIGKVDSSYANRDGAAIRYITETFSFNLESNLLILITDGVPVSLNYDGRQALEDTCHAMYSASQKNIMLRYFNIGGLPDEIYQAFKTHCNKTNIFYQPEDMISHAPVFVSDLIEELAI
jgi:hypothetical protein